MVKKSKMTLDKLAQITAHGFAEVNGRLNKMDKKLDDKVNKVDLKKTEKKFDKRFDKTNDKIDNIHKDIFRFERIQMAEIERDDRQDLQIKELETKV